MENFLIIAVYAGFTYLVVKQCQKLKKSPTKFVIIGLLIGPYLVSAYLAIWGNKKTGKSKGKSGNLFNDAFKQLKLMKDGTLDNPRGQKAIICPFCQTRGSVRVSKKQDTSGLKMTGAALTFGLSTMITGVNKHQTRIQAFCGVCRQKWDMGTRKW